MKKAIRNSSMKFCLHNLFLILSLICVCIWLCQHY